MADSHVLYNGGTVSVVYDAKGHALDVGDRIVGNPNGALFSRLISTGRLTDLGPADDSTGQVAVADDSTENGG